MRRNIGGKLFVKFANFSMEKKFSSTMLYNVYVHDGKFDIPMY
jgi:hypothetical protein